MRNVWVEDWVPYIALCFIFRIEKLRALNQFYVCFCLPWFVGVPVNLISHELAYSRIDSLHGDCVFKLHQIELSRSLSVIYTLYH